jgi:Ubiquitin carboxyl-terminal hydrolase
LQALVTHPFFLEKMKNIIPTVDPVKKANETDRAFEIRLEDHTKLDTVQAALKNFYRVFSNEQVTPSLLHQAIVNLRNCIFESKIHGSLETNEVLHQQDAADFFAVILQALNYVLTIETKRQDLSLKIESTKKNDNQLFLLSKPKDKAVSSIEKLIQESILETTIDDVDNIWKPTDKDGKTLEVSSYNNLMRIANPEPPQVICFQIKRFEYDPITKREAKMQDRFSFESEILDLSSVFSSTSEKPVEPVFYRLSSCINHHGGSLRGGHYTSYVRKEDHWYHCNDSTVTAVSAAEVKKEEAYILILEKINEPIKNTTEVQTSAIS